MDLMIVELSTSVSKVSLGLSCRRMGAGENHRFVQELVAQGAHEILRTAAEVLRG